MRASPLLAVTVLSSLLLTLWPGSALAQGAASDQAVLRYQWMLKRNPGDAGAYYRLGDAYIQKARETGDPSYFTLAEQALRKSLEITPQSGVLRHLAYVLYSRHEFEEAALQATRAIEADPGDAHAWGVLGDAYQEIGKYEQAQDAYERMMRIHSDLYSLSRLSGLKTLRGDPKGAIEELDRAVQEGRVNRRPRESIAWTEWQLGNEHFATGNLKEAEAQYLEALKTYPNYHRALVGLAQVRAAQKRYPEAIDLYSKALAVIPQPDYAAALGDVYTKAGRPEEARRQYELVEYIGRLNTLNRVLYNRELAYFYADHDVKLSESLDLARRELDVRKDIYAYDVLAWALHKNGNSREALTAMREALKLGTRDARLFFHAGMIYQRLGQAEKATEYLERALSTNPNFHVLFADVAERTLRELETRSTSARLSQAPDAQ